MELKKILVGLEGIKAKGNVDLEIKGIEKNSKEVKEGYMFVAIKGFSTDGHQYVESAIENGAIAVMVEEGCDLKALNIPENVTILMVPDTRKALAVMGANYYDNPSKKMKIIGITGTNGKTTTTSLMYITSKQ